MVSNQVEIIKKECHSEYYSESDLSRQILSCMQNDIQYM